MNNKFFIGQQVKSCTKYDKTAPISKVILMQDSETAYEAGDDSGYAITITCPYATQKMANDLLAKAKGFRYQGYEATQLVLPLSAELGDAVTVDGVYGMIANRKVSFTPGFTSDVNSPYEEEVDHEYQYEGTYKQELNNKVTLGKYYYGTKITRKDGLIIEKTDGEDVSAKVVLNADELSFYAGSDKVLYFDPAAKTYKFTGTINVNDTFIVDEYGNLTLGGNIVFTGESSFTQVRYSLDKNASIPNDWTEQWDDSWGNNSTEVWAIYSYNAGSTWTSPRLVQGKTGAAGSDADVTFENIKSALQQANNVETTFITADEAGAPVLYGGKIYGGEIYAGYGESSDGYAKMTSMGFDVIDSENNHKIGLGIDELHSGITSPYLILGAGSGYSSSDAGLVKKFPTGLWIGDSSAKGIIDATYIPGTGFFLSFASNIIYRVISGNFTEVGSGTAVFG